MDPGVVAREFANYYYEKFGQDRDALRTLYKESSMLTWEGKPFQGGETILEKLKSLPFEKVEHRVLTCDAQPSDGNGVVVFVTGLLVIDDSTNPLQFTQVFQLRAGEQGFWVHNDIFRLILG